MIVFGRFRHPTIVPHTRVFVWIRKTISFTQTRKKRWTISGVKQVRLCLHALTSTVTYMLVLQRHAKQDYRGGPPPFTG